MYHYTWHYLLLKKKVVSIKYAVLKMYKFCQAVLVYTFNPSTWKTEAHRSLCVKGHPGLHKIDQSKKKKQSQVGMAHSSNPSS